MTQPNGPILFNASTGSDTAASGCGPATAVSGSAAAHTNGSASTTITLTNTPDLSGVSAGDVLWLNTSTGRQFSVIASVDDGADTVTVDDSFTIALASAVDYAIGGKRATWDNADSRTIFAATGAKAGWIIETETDQTLNSAITVNSAGDTTNGLVVIRGDSPTVRRVITQTANVAHFQPATSGGQTFANMKFDNTNATKTSANAFSLFNCVVQIHNCEIGDATNTLNKGVTRGGGSPYVRINDCIIHNCTTSGLDVTSMIDASIVGSVIHSCGDGIVVAANTSFFLLGCIIRDNSDDGLIVTGGGNRALIVRNNIFYSNDGDGIDCSGAAAANYMSLFGNIFVSNGGYGFNGHSAIDEIIFMNSHNAYYNNTSGDRNNLSAGTGDVSMSADPFVDAASADFNINNFAGGGALLRAATVTMP